MPTGGEGGSIYLEMVYRQGERGSNILKILTTSIMDGPYEGQSDINDSFSGSSGENRCKFHPLKGTVECNI